MRGAFRLSGAADRRAVLRGAAAAAAALLLGRAGAARAVVNVGHPAFLVIGDWGDPGEPQRRVAGAFALAAERMGVDFVVSTGDNFYTVGVDSTFDPLWKSAFEDVYAAPALQCDWFMVLGNHDWRGNVQAELDYAAKDPRWRMPARYYRHGVALSDGTEADFVFIDTTALIYGPGADAQIAWLDRELAASAARWKIVVGHHPVHSGGRHGGDPTLVERVEPLLRRHGAHVYLNGHDHDLEHIVVGGVHYLTVGSGAHVRRTSPIEGTLFAAATLGFMAARLLPEALSVEFIDADGHVLHAATIPA